MTAPQTTETERPTIRTVAEAQTRLRQVRDLGVSWLLDHVAKDGTPVCSSERNGYHRVPWTLAFVGEREVAATVLSWIERNALNPVGDLAKGVPREAWVGRAAPYPLSLIAQGAWTLERYDTALAVMNTLRTSFIDPKSGGAYWERQDVDGASDRQYLFPTAQVGLAGLMTGQMDIADAAFTWFTRLMQAQPDLPNRFFTGWNAQGLITDMGSEDAFMSVTDFRLPLQAFYNPGIGAAFLSRYFMHTGEKSARDMALTLLELSDKGTADQFNYWESMQVCKVGWGSAIALEMDPSPVHQNRLLRMAQWYSDSQASDGTWVPSGFLIPKPTDSHAMEKTAEHVLWVGMMLVSLAAAEERGKVSRF